ATPTAFVVRRKLAGEGVSGVEPLAPDLEVEFTAGLEERRRWEQVDLDRGHLARHQVLGDIVPRRAVGAGNVVGEAPDAMRDQGAAEPVGVLKRDFPAVADLTYADEQARITALGEADREP